MKTAFIIGNGTSRNGFDLNRLKPYGDIFGCNALYRDFYPDYLVSIDEGMIAEINKSDFPQNRFIVPPLDECWEPSECNMRRPRSNAGINAMREAIKMGYDQLICLGFDFLLIDETQSVSNLYDGTENYSPQTRANFYDNKGRMNYLHWVIKTNSNVDFIFIFPDNLTVNEIRVKNMFLNTYSNLIKFTEGEK